ncbi:MAG TPA: UDP-N-acetylmuramate dehydrogenase [Burkholderiales bacterium]|nr:UDP-N-acetylmuramate dehydrogenase [Burkholderiales bacterium]
MNTETVMCAVEQPESGGGVAAGAGMRTVRRACVDMVRQPELRGVLRHDEPMSRHVSWRAGGNAARTYQPADMADLQVFIKTLPANEAVYFVGLGSNLLVRDGGLDATVVFSHWAMRTLRLEPDGHRIYAECGLPSPKVARFAALHGLVGAEFLAGIPGTVGGALAMNAGCYGGETWDIVERGLTIDRHGNLHERMRAQYELAYRSVHLKEQTNRRDIDEWFVASTFRLVPGDGVASRERIRELLGRRIATQPLGEPNAGSVFRNPDGDFAARLIEACGLKGYSIGDAVISPKHANFIVNRGRARAADIESLIEAAQSAVKARFGVELEREVRIIGERAA